MKNFPSYNALIAEYKDECDKQGISPDPVMMAIYPLMRLGASIKPKKNEEIENNEEIMETKK